MKHYLKSSLALVVFPILIISMLSSCTIQEVVKMEDEETVNPIVGKWFLKTVNETDVSNINCYEDSFIESDANTITFFLMDRLENDDCETVLDNTQDLTNQDDFYYVGDEALDIYIDGGLLTWRVDKNTSLEFRK